MWGAAGSCVPFLPYNLPDVALGVTLFYSTKDCYEHEETWTRPERSAGDLSHVAFHVTSLFAKRRDSAFGGGRAGKRQITRPLSAVATGKSWDQRCLVRDLFEARYPTA